MSPSLLAENTISLNKWEKEVRKQENIWEKCFEETPGEGFTEGNGCKKERWRLEDKIWGEAQGCEGNIRADRLMGSMI